MTDFIFGSIDGIGATLGRYAVLTQDAPWNLVKDRIEGRAVSVTMVTNLEHEYLDDVADALPAPIDTVMGIGGGVSIDAAKYCTWKRKCPAILVPTILSVDAYVSLPVAVRENGVVNYYGNVVPDKIVIDYKAIQSAPKRRFATRTVNRDFGGCAQGSSGGLSSFFSHLTLNHLSGSTGF
jgi:glycerol dehydrogenase-like iron-containing ADH family enzyme